MSQENVLDHMLDTIEKHNYTDLREQMLNILESAVYGNASGYARNELHNMWLEIQDRIDEDSIPPDAEKISLLNPTFNVD